MNLQITALYAALLTPMMIVLMIVVSANRGRAGVSILDGGDRQLAIWMRRHGNFIENIPMALLLMGLAELAGFADWALHMFGLVLIAGRVMHIVGMDVDRPFAMFRFIGTISTQLVMLSCAAFLIWVQFF